MADATFEGAYAALIKEIRSVAPYKHRYDVFRDFVTMAAISLHNAVRKDEGRESEYLALIGSYQPKDQQAFPKLMALLIEALQFEPRDVLGTVYMDLELGSRERGQFFTPQHLCEAMAAMLHGDELEHLERPFITLSEPACGAGGMVLAFVKEMQKHGHNPARRLWVQCIDVDRLSALMCYIQLSLWDVPAVVLVGNTLSLEMRETWFTFAHVREGWSARLQARDAEEAAEKPVEEVLTPEAPITPPESSKPATSHGTPQQFDFGF